MNKLKNTKSIADAKFVLLPLCFAIYPIIFHYRNNLAVAPLSSAIRVLSWFTLVASIVYLILLPFGKGRHLYAANASLPLLGVLFFYGVVFEVLRKIDLIAIEHYSLMPFLLFAALYLSKAILELKEDASMRLWKSILFVLGGLLLVNLTSIVIQNVRLQIEKPRTEYLNPSPQLGTDSEKYPDIFFIVFDEMAGFQTLRDYWGYTEVDNFADYLRENGFYVAENSHSSSISTLNQLATRLNFQFYEGQDLNAAYAHHQQAIIDNNTMRYLKSQGYTTVVFSELNSDFLFAAMPSINADIVYEAPEDYYVSSGSVALDDFALFLLNNTVAAPWLIQIDLASHEQHRRMLFFTIETVPALDVASPKFVFVHLAIPHRPFLFDQDGGLLELKDHDNWDAYLGQYIFSLRLARTLLDDILASADPSNPPVIIFQSDHGARNGSGRNNLKNYPDEYKTWIVNAMLLPYCEDAPLSQDMDPINTFPIVFNCYFDANIPLQ